jgi:hypothetical protein
VPSFISSILADGNVSLEEEQAVELAAITMYLAGFDTVSIQIFYTTQTHYIDFMHSLRI